MQTSSRAVVVGVDGSAPARAALEYAWRDAACRDASLRVVAAYVPPEYTQIWLETEIGTDIREHDEVTAEVRRAAQAQVDEVRAALATEPAPPAVEVVAVVGAPARVLLAQSRDADLLVVGSRGHGGFASMLLGSVSLQATLHASCPVTVVRPVPAARTVAAEREADVRAEGELAPSSSS
jgi:nucleotide-binding universal stress UspA family protein